MEFFWHEKTSPPLLAHGGKNVHGFQRKSNKAGTHDREQTCRKRFKDEVAAHVGSNYPDTLDSIYVAQSVEDSLYPLEEVSVENTTTIEECQGFYESSQRTTKTTTGS